MGRRQLPKIPPALDYAAWRLVESDLPQVWNAAAIFGRVAPLEFEIGSGKGMFLAKAASRNDQHDFLGIEIGKKYASFAAATLARAQVQNARIVCGDAAQILRDILPSSSLFAVHIYFPDPWWKRAHRKRRIVREEVVQLVENRLVSGGTLHFWTDVEEYFETGQNTIFEYTSLARVEIAQVEIAKNSESITENYSTHFERRTLLQQQQVFRATFLKTL